MTDKFLSTLLSGAEKLDISVSTEQAEKLYYFYKSVVNYNKFVNLTAVTDETVFVIKHILDSVSSIKLFTKNASVADVGAGAGFPSIPLKILRPDLSFTLIEATGKKVDFVNSAIATLGLTGITALHLRAEEAGRGTLRGSFDYVVSRAVGRIPVLLELSAPLLKNVGIIICYKGRDLAELNTAETAIKTLHLSHIETLSFELPDGTGERNLILFKKLSETPSGFPRSYSQMTKNPL